MTDERQAIITATGKQPHSCTCDRCKSMCQHCPCIGTPQDILKIIEAGHADKIAATRWAVGLQFGLPIITMFQIKDNGFGCAFHNEIGLCDLHDLGLKPTEGQLASHEGQVIKPGAYPVVVYVALTWLNPDNKATIEAIISKLGLNLVIKETSIHEWANK